MGYQEGDVIQLEDGLHYAIINRIELNGNLYFNMLSVTKPLNIKIVKVTEDPSGTVLEEVSNKEEFDSIMQYISELDIEED